jgi:hypothetical protein
MILGKSVMSELSANNLSNPATMTADEGDLNLIEVMEIFSTICVTHPIRLLQILDDCCAECTPENFRESSMAEFMSLKLSPFGRRLRQIH